MYIKDNIFEGYLDSEKNYYDYGTAPVSGNDVVDTTKTGVSYYQDFLNPSKLKYMQEEKNLTGNIVMMSPEEYYQRCAKDIFNTTAESLKRQREHDKNTLQKLVNVLTVYKRKLCLPFLNYADNGQEGLHRMYVLGELYGWNTKQPVLVITQFDEDRAVREKESKKQAEIQRHVERAIKDALSYNYGEFDEFEEQLNWSLEREFRYIDDYEDVTCSVKELENSLIVTVLGNEFPIDKDDIHLIDSVQDSEDLDITNEEDIDFLDKYLPDWRERSEEEQNKLLKTLLGESVEPIIDKQVLIDVLDECNHSYYSSTSMCCETICEKLYYDHGIDARYTGRSIYVEDKKVAVVKVSLDGPQLLGMYDYIVCI